jgi:LysM repeat protein
LLSIVEGSNPEARKTLFMDTSLSDNRSNSNLLVFVVAGAAVLALVLGIVGLMQASKANKELAALKDLPATVSAADQKATTAATDARAAKANVVSLQAQMERALSDQFADIRGNIARVEDMAKQALERPAAATPRGGGDAGGGGTGVVTAPPGSLDADGAYVIKTGDTFGKIAPQFGVSVSEIVAANPGVDPRRLKVGQKIIIPKK